MIETLVEWARIRAEAVMIDSVSIDRTTSGAFNPATGDHSESTVNVYTGKGRVRGPSVASVTVTERQAGDAEQVVSRPVLLLPWSASAAVLIGDTVTVSGTEYTVVGYLETSTQTARSFLIERVG